MRKYARFISGIVVGVIVILSIPILLAQDKGNSLFGYLEKLFQQNNEQLKQNEKLIDMYGQEIKELKTSFHSCVQSLQNENTKLQSEFAQYKQNVQYQLQKQAIRITYISGSVTDDTDNGILKSRTLSFSKFEQDSVLRITHSDNCREIRTSGDVTHWRVFIDGSCVLTTGLHSPTGNILRRSTSIGYAKGISAGKHLLTVEVQSGGDAHTGWNSDFLVQVEEIPKEMIMDQK